MKLKSVVLSLLCLACTGALLAQMAGLHGDFREHRRHRIYGNRLRAGHLHITKHVDKCTVDQQV